MTSIFLKPFRFFIPPQKWRPPVVVLLGMAAGLTAYILYVSNSIAYLSDDPRACINCHIMAPQFATWQYSAHYQRATCNDCHVPHDNIFNTYYFKAKDGLRHAAMFTLRLEPQVIRIHQAGQKAVLENCLRCHGGLVENLTGHSGSGQDLRPCWECHRETPHGRQRSLASVPNAQVPLLRSSVPDWFKKLMEPKQ